MLRQPRAYRHSLHHSPIPKKYTIDDKENVYKKYGYGNKGQNPAIKESNSDMKCVIMWSKLCKYSKIEVIENIE